MSVYNESINELEQSINSVLTQNYEDFELIVISDNPSNFKANDYLKNKAKSDARITLIFNSSNMGQNLSRNKAIESSKNDYIAIIDADDIMTADRLQVQLDFMISNDLQMSFSNVSIIDEKGIVTRKRIYKLGSITSQKTMRKLLTSHSIVLGPTLMFKKSSFVIVNGYRDINVEDYDLVCRFLVKNERIGFIGSSLLKKRLRKNSISFGTLFEQYVIMKSISDYLKETNLQKIVPVSYIQKKLDDINCNELKSYGRYANLRYSFNDGRNFFNFIKLMLSILTSLTVIKHTIWTVKNKIIEICIK